MVGVTELHWQRRRIAPLVSRPTATAIVIRRPTARHVCRASNMPHRARSRARVSRAGIAVAYTARSAKIAAWSDAASRSLVSSLSIGHGFLTFGPCQTPLRFSPADWTTANSSGDSSR
jgi:hypothetical protein